MSIPEPSAEPWHPAWCSPEHCRAGERVRARHCSVPVSADLGTHGDAWISAQLIDDSHQPPEASTPTLELVLERTDGLSREGYWLEPAGYHQLLGVLLDDTIADPMRAEFDRAVAEYQRDNPETGEPVPDHITGYVPGAGNSGPGWPR